MSQGGLSELAILQERLTIALAAARMGVWDLDLKISQLKWDDVTQSIFGFVPGTFPGTVEAAAARTHSEDREYIFAERARAFATGTPFRCEYRVIWPDGTLRWVLSSAVAIRGPDGTPTHMIGTIMDVTDRKEVEERFRSLADSMAQLVWITDESGQIEFVNQRWYEYSGVPRRPYREFPWRTVVHPDDESQVVRAHERALKSHSSFEVQYRIRRHDGTYRWHLARTVFVKDAAGGAFKRFGTATDIHDQIVAIEKLEESERYFREFAEGIPQPAWLADNVTGVIHFNRRYYEECGIPAGGPRPNWEDFIHPEDLPAMRASHERVSATGELIEQVYRRRMADGSYKWFMGRTLGIKDADGKVVKRFGTSVDIHEQKRLLEQEREARERAERSEARLRLLSTVSSTLASSLDFDVTLQSIAEKVVPEFCDGAAIDLVQGDGSIQRVAAFHPDPFKARLLKEIMRKFPIAGNTALHPIERAIGLAKPELLGVVDQVLLEKLALGRPAGYIEEVSKIGMTSIVVAPLHSQERVAGALVFLTTRESGRRLRESDLALAQELAERASAAIENARLFREAQAALAQANQAVRMRDEFLSIASHELRTPVTSMKIRAEMMIQGLDKGDAKVFAPERVERVMRESNKSLDRLTRLIEDMLDISRIQTGRLALNVESTSLASIAGEVLERFSQQLAAAGIEARLETEAQAEGNWDSSRLDQVVTNLITNALRYAPGKPLMVRVRSSGARAILEVEDQGPGIAPENQEKIFQRFERLVSANEVSGMGLGLYISREILRAHGGEIRVRSELGRGAAFVVDLPLT